MQVPRKPMPAAKAAPSCRASRAHLRAAARRLPDKPGVYLMKDKAGSVIYVGKAKSLRHRVSSYFRSLAADQLKTRKLASHVHSFDVTMVRTELEALLLERSLIKVYDPTFNILLRDDKSFPYIRADLNSPWPRINIVRKREPHDGATYIGPYSNQKLLFSAVEWVHKIFPLVRCSPYEFAHAKRPCNYYGMKLCLGPCHHPVDAEQYRELVRQALKVLRGHHDGLAKDLETKMLAASAAEDYAEAAMYRDGLQALNQLKHQDQSTYKRTKEGDVIAWCAGEQHVSIYVLHVRDHIVSGCRDFILPNTFAATYSAPHPEAAPGLHHDHNHLLEQFLMQFYATEPPPPKIYTMLPLSQPQLLSQALAHRPLEGEPNHHYCLKPPKFLSPQGAETKRLMAMATSNAEYALLNHRQLYDTKQQALANIADELDLNISLRRIECVDISHFAGSAVVGAGVSFLWGMPDKSAYRKYNLKLTSPEPAYAHNDDYAAIRQVIRRRLAHFHTEENPPDVIVIDGGRGQLRSALQAAADVFAPGESRPHFLAIAKIRGPQAAGPAQFDRIFTEHDPKPILLTKGSAAHRLFAQIRDEAHRFAITHHRRTLRWLRHSSQLEQIKGIGPATRKQLLTTFGSLHHLRQASIADLAKVKGMSPNKAKALKQHLRR